MRLECNLLNPNWCPPPRDGMDGWMACKHSLILKNSTASPSFVRLLLLVRCASGDEPCPFNVGPEGDAATQRWRVCDIVHGRA